MKRLMKWIIPLLLVVLLIGSAVWYMLVYDRSTVQDFLIAQARNSARDGHFSTATWFYNLSYKLSDKDQDVAIELAKIYKSAGNYTKAEATLTNAIGDGGNAELYLALCQTYVEQDKLLDAVNMLDNIADASVKAELDAQRPAAPTVDQPSGFYSQYITLNFTAESGKLYVTTDGEYPSTASEPSNGSITLKGGETKIYALCVSENSLVSPVSIFNYTVGGVVEDVTLADPAIDAQVRSTLMLGPDTTLSTEDLWGITELTVPAEAASLEDLKHFISLKQLTIDGHNVSDLSMLASMTGLQELSITNGNLSASLSVLRNLPDLKKITLSGCSISSLADFSAPSATYLDLSDNAVSDISSLSDMTMLEYVNLSNNAVKDASPLSGMPGLTELNLANNAIDSLSPLSSCTSLTTLDVSGNGLTDLSALQSLAALTSLGASHNTLTNVDALSGCTSLSKLDVSHNKITSLDGVAGLYSITELNFSHNEVTALPDLSGGSELVQIIGDYNQLTDISSLDSLANLNYVLLDYNPELSDISALATCTRLTQVNAFGTKVSTESATPLLDMGVVVNYDPTAATTAE